MLALVAGVPSRNAQAQSDDERTTVRIEAEIITGLDSGSLPGGLSTTTQAPTQTPTGVTTTDAGDATDPDEPAVDQPDVAAQTQARQAPGVDQVASNLMASAQDGSLTVSDTAMVAALNAGRRSQHQNLEALVTITVIDESGNIRTTTMRNTDLTADQLSPAVGPGMIGQAVQPTLTTQTVLAGDVMRRSSGMTYFYVQVCSCGI